MDAGRGQDRLTIVERPPTTFYPTSMDSLNQQQHHQQLRAGTAYGDLCRAQGPTDALSAAYHSRYLASLPALSSASGSSFPFLSSMFASGPTSPFRAPSAPGVSSCGTNGTTNPMRQQLFWPPTPPPDGYGRYGLNTSLFPLFGSMSPSPTDGGAAAAAYMLSQGLVSRHLTPCTTTTSSSHHLLDTHKDQGFFSPGFGLGSPLTPSSQLTTTNPFSHHLIPPPHPLDYNKYPNFIPPPGLNSASTKDFLATVNDDSKSQPHHHHHHHHHSANCQLTVKSENSSSPSTTSISSNVTAVKHSHPPVTTSSKSSRSERKSSYSPGRSKDTRHNEDIKPQAKNQDESINKHYQQSRHLQHYFPPSGIKSCSPFEIDVTCGPTIKPDMLSPPMETSSDAALPGSPYQDKKKELSPPDESRCLSCANDVFKKNDVPKAEEEDEDENSVVVVIVDSDDKVSRSSPKIESADDAVPHNSSTTVMTKSGDVRSDDRSDSPKNSVSPAPPVPNSVFLTFDKSDSNFSVTNNRTDTVVNGVNSKHVTAAVIPTAPKQQHLSNYYLSRVDSLNSTLSHQTSSSESDVKGTCRASSDSPKTTLSALSKIKSEAAEPAESTLPVTYQQNSSSNFCRHLNSKAACTKVKDMIKSIDSPSKQNSSQSQVAVVDGHQTTFSSMDKTFRTASPSVMKLCPVIPEKTVQGKVQAMTVDSKKRIVGPLKAESPVFRFDSFNSDSSQKQSLVNWSKATVSPFNWQQKEEDQQAMNLTVSKKKLESFSSIPSTENNNVDVADSMDAIATISTNPNSPKTPYTVENIISTSNTTTTSCCVSGTGVIGVCHPNVSKGKVFAVGGSVSKFSAMTSVTSQMDVGNDGEVHLSSHSVHATKSSTFQTLNAATAACLSRAASVTGFQNSKSQLKTERLVPHVRSKAKDSEKIISSGGRATTLATLAPKLTKKLGFLKDSKSSHTLSTSSSVSSTSIVFPATVNPCIPVGIAIAQQRQDSSTTATIGKNHSSVVPASAGIVPPTTPLTTSRVPNEIQQSQEFLRDQKPQDISCPNSAVSSDSTNFLVTQGPTIVSRQWESEAVTRATLPSPWVAQGPIVAPALWIGQGATATAAYAATSATPASTPQLPAPIPTPVNPLETSPISLPPGGYQLARDSVTGHLFLIPAANIVDRTAMWPSYNPTSGSTLPIQQLVTQQHHTQFEQVLPQGESGKDMRTVDSCCDAPGSYKTTELHGIKTEDKESSNHVPSVPLASGQTFTFTTFPTPCDPSGFSYVLQSSTVMHLAHTAQTTSIQTDSGKRSQGTSPLHPATPSPSPSLPMSSILLMSENDDEEEEPQDSDCDGVVSGESNQMKMLQQTQSVTTAVQVDMDSRTNSEEEEEEVDEEDEIKSSLVGTEQVKMSDSANQTENVLSDSGKGDSETELFVEEITDETKKAAVIQAPTPCTNESLVMSTDVMNTNKMSNDSPSNDIVVAEDGEIAPSLPVESKPVMDFIDHHGLDLLVDSIEEFASRERQETRKEEEQQQESKLTQSRFLEIRESSLNEKIFSTSTSSYGTLDTSSCTDGLGLLCALAEQRFFEEVCNTDGPMEKPAVEKPTYDCYSFLDEEGSHNVNTKYCSPKKDASLHRNISSSPSFQQILDAPVDDLPSSNLQACEKEMRKRLADLQRKYKKKQLQLARLMPNGESDDDDDDPLIELENKTTDARTNFQSKKIFSFPRFKHKTVAPRKPHSYKTMVQSLTNSRTNLSSNFQKRNFQKTSRTAELSRHIKSSLNHSKETTNSSLAAKQSETKVKKQSKGQIDNPYYLNKSNFFNKSKIMKKNVQKDGLSKPSASGNDKSPSLKVSRNKTKSSFSQKFPVVAKHQTSPDSTIPVTKSKPGDTSRSLKLSTNSLHGTSKHQMNISHNRTSSENTLKRKAVTGETKYIKKMKIEKVKSTCHSESKNSVHEEPSQIKKSKTNTNQLSDHNDSEDKGKSKVPFFDEQAWCVRRSERIFLNDTRPPSTQQNASNGPLNNNVPKKANPQQANVSPKLDSGLKDKKENSVKTLAKVSDVKLNTAVKTEKDEEQSWKPIKNKFITKPKTKLPDQMSSSKKRCISSSSSKSSEASLSSSVDSSDDSNSSHSENMSHVTLNKPSPATVATVEKIKKTENESHPNSMQQKEVISVNSSQGGAKSCILDLKLEDNTRVLVLEDGLFYAGHIIGIEAPDVYGIILDGKRTHRPRIFSREEILNAAVLEVKPTETAHLPEGSRVCAYWSQQYRCLYPGTVAKASSPLPDPSLLFVEFDDGDSGRIPLNDIRMLPPDFPIVSMEENSYLLFGKRKSRNDKENPSEQKDQNHTSLQKFEKVHTKDSPKIKKKRIDSADGKRSRDCSKSEHQFPANRKSTTENQSTPSKHYNASIPASTNTDKIKSKKMKIKDEGNKKKKVRSRESSVDAQLKGKKRKKHREEHKHHHKHKHHHHKHHHKKHKQVVENPYDSSQETSKVGPLYSPSHEGELMILTAEKTSDLTVTIKTSPSPHTAANHAKHTELSANEKPTEKESTSSKQSLDGNENSTGFTSKTKINKKKKIACETKPAKRKERVPSVEKSKIAAFLPVRQLWRWSGKGFRRPGAKGKGKKEFFRAIQRGKELLRVGDCAVFLSTGRPHLPYIGRIETMWESWGGKMDVRVKWFYHPEETKSSKKLTHLKGALFQSPHFDENDVQTISHKCEVLSWEDYQERKDQDMDKTESPFFDNNDTYYLAGTYDPITGNLIMEPGVPKISTSEN